MQELMLSSGSAQLRLCSRGFWCIDGLERARLESGLGGSGAWSGEGTSGEVHWPLLLFWWWCLEVWRSLVRGGRLVLCIPS